MVEKAIVLMETKAGHTQDVASALRELEGVESVDVVTGIYDIIATVGGEDMGTIADLVATRIHAVRGVDRTLTCLSM